MALKIVGSVTVKVEFDSGYQILVISASDFSLEESGLRDISDGDYQYEALYIYHGNDDHDISFQAVNYQGNVSMMPYTMPENMEIIENEMTVEALPFDNEDFF